MGKFVIKTQKDGQFVFRLLAGNGQEIYAAKRILQACMLKRHQLGKRKCYE
jgi:hypothetical protein